MPTVADVDPVVDGLVGNVGLGLVASEPIQDVSCCQYPVTFKASYRHSR